jgi:hypothetical protein
MGKKQLIKQIREIAKRIPPVKEQHMSGFFMDEDKKPQPNIYLVDVNHERRLRKAYEDCGMEGIKKYLDSIHQLQLKRKDEISKEPVTTEE